MTTPATSWVQAIPGAQDAINFIVKELAEFQGVPARLQNVSVWLNRIVGAGGPVAAQAQQLQAVESQVESSFASAAQQISVVVPELQQAGLLSLDLSVIGDAVTAAASVSSVLTATQELEQETASLARDAGLGTFAAGPGGMQGAFPWTKYLLWGGLAYAGFFLVVRRPKRVS